jgi:hypothetical protein
MMIKNDYFGSIWHNRLIFLSHGPHWKAHLLHEMMYVGTLPVTACPDYNLSFPIVCLWSTSLAVYSDCSSNPVGWVMY